MKLGSSDIGSVYLGANEVQKVYLGSNLVWENSAGFDADYQAILDYATTQGYTLPSSGQQVLQNQLMLDLKTAGVWSELDTFAVFATDGNSDFALIDWVRLLDMTAVNSPTFTADEGFTGNGTSSYIDLNYTTSTDWNNVTEDSACLFAYAFADVNPSNNVLLGTEGTMNLINPRNPSNQITSRLHTIGLGSQATSNGQGLTLLNRSSILSYDVWQRGSFVGNVAITTDTTSQKMYSMRIATSYSPSKPSIIGYSASLTSTQIGDLTSLINTYMAAL